MMSYKMTRFLQSIHIENIDDFDLEFEMVGYDRFDKTRLNMVIVKQTPWKYSLLREFQDGLETITYRYLLRFSYLVRPNYYDVVSLFEDWYQTIYRLPHNLELSGDDETINIEYQNVNKFSCLSNAPVCNQSSICQHLFPQKDALLTSLGLPAPLTHRLSPHGHCTHAALSPAMPPFR